MPTVNIYIDGFNLYYGALRNRWPQYKWLDLQGFCERLLPGREVKRIRYFTAQVRSTPQNPGAANRQRIYLRALATLPKAEIRYGYFSTHDVRLPHAYPLSGGGMSEAGFPGFDGLSGLRSSDGSVAPNPVHPINLVNLASDKLPKWLTRTQFGIARSEVRRWRMAISFQERRSLPRRDCRAALAMTVWGRLPRCARNDSLGKVGTREVRLPLANPPQNGPATALVRRTEEKGSDANLAAYLLLDCCQKDCDEVVVISNGSDFAEPIRLARDVLQMSIGIINPSQRNRSVQLWQAALWSYPTINERVFRNSQLPRRLTDANGTFSKPPTW